MVSSQLKDHVGLLVTLLAQAKQLKFLIFYLLYCKFKQQRTNTPIFHFKKFTDVSCYIRHLLHECTWWILRIHQFARVQRNEKCTTGSILSRIRSIEQQANVSITFSVDSNWFSLTKRRASIYVWNVNRFYSLFSRLRLEHGTAWKKFICRLAEEIVYKKKLETSCWT